MLLESSNDTKLIKMTGEYMAFDKKLLDIIACPSCKGSLILGTLPNQQEKELICKFDRLAYAIKENIPVLLENEARELSSEEIAELKSSV